MQLTLFGKKTQAELQKPFIPSKHEFETAQIKIGQDPEVLKQEKEEAKKCPMCKRFIEKYFDIAPDLPNGEFCVDCIRKRHFLTGAGYTDQGNRIQFVSQTTGIVVKEYKDFTRVFETDIFSNPVFPYCINCHDAKYGTNCLGVTKECAEFLIQKLDLKQHFMRNEAYGDLEYHEPKDDDSEGEPIKEWVRLVE